MKLIAVLLAVVLSGCPYIKNNTDIRECAASTTVESVNILIPQIAAVISGKAPDWESALNSIVLEFGSAAVCAIQAVLNDLTFGIDPVTKLNIYTVSFDHVSLDEQILRCKSFLGDNE